MKYPLCWGISCCDPAVIAVYSTGSISKRLKKALNCIQEAHWLSPKQCDKVEKDFLNLVKKKDFHSACKAYKRSKERLDEFWMAALEQYNGSPELTKFIKIVLLSHGNAFVERGFSTNKEIEVENQKHQSLIAQRQIYDGVMAETGGGDVTKVQITKVMMNKVRHSRQDYMAALEEQRKKNNESAEDRVKRKRVIDDLKELQEKRRLTYDK